MCALQMRIAGKKVLKLIGAVRCTSSRMTVHTRKCACCVERLEVISTSTNLNVYTPHCVCVCGLVRACVRNINSLANEPSIFSFSNEHTFYSNFSLLCGLYIVYIVTTHHTRSSEVLYIIGMPLEKVFFFWFACTERWRVYMYEIFTYTLRWYGGNFGCGSKSVWGSSYTRTHCNRWAMKGVGIAATNNYKL